MRARWLLLAAVLAAGQARALTGNEQVALVGQGRYQELVEGLEAARAAGRPLKAADLHALCFGYSKIKRYDRILDCLTQLDTAFRGPDKSTRLFGLEDGTPTVYLMRAEALVELGEYPQAIAEAGRALEWYRREKGSEVDILIDALAVKTLAEVRLGQRAEAEKTAAELEKVRLGFLGSEAVSVKALAMARVGMALQRWQAVLDALASDRTFQIRNFLHNAASGAYLRGINEWLWLEVPRAYMHTKAMLELGRVDDARAAYDRLLATPDIDGNASIYWLSLFDRGTIAEKDGDLQAAEQAYLKAVEVLDRQRRTIDSEANKIGFIGDKQAVYQRLLAVQLKRGNLGAALQTAERAKARAFVDLLASRAATSLVRQGDPRAATHAEVIVKMNAAELEGRLQHTRVGSRSGRSGTAPATELATQLPEDVAALVRVSAPEAAEVQRLLREDESLLLYFGDTRQLQAFVVRRDGIHSAPIDGNGLEDEVRRLRKSIQDAAPGASAQLRALQQRLLAPVAAHLQGKRLTIVPHGPLHYVPFAALNDGTADLIDRFSVRVLPSVSVLKFLRKQGQAPFPQGMLVFGNPDLGNAKLDLPFAEVEARQLHTRYKANHLFLRREANRNAFERHAPESRFIHVASHGEFDASKPLNSGLILATPEGPAGQDRLTVADLYRLRLDAELVTMSACETGVGSVMNGDDVIGLTRGFLYAGASTVVASLWNVDDEATSFLMLQMYEQLAAGGQDDFLRAAQLATRAKYPHPVFWASFYRTGQF